MRIKLTNVFVTDQEKALQFYTGTLGLVKKSDISAGEYRWLTLVSPEEPDGTQLVLEPNTNPAARAYQEAIFMQGIPATMFFVDDIKIEHDRLKKMGVAFKSGPTQAGPAMIAIFEDTCGNLIQISQVTGY
jgi:catechol 2,3-dioxygenase-like lactoylglutathione lyase family enzyme